MDASSLLSALTSRPDAPASSIITGTAVGASADGSVLVQVDGSAVAQPSEEAVTLTVPTDEFAGGAYVLPSAPYPGTLTVEDDNGDALEEEDYELDGDELTIFALSSDPVSVSYDAEVRQALTNDDFASGSVTVESTTNLQLLEDVGGPGTADWQPAAYTLDGDELTVAGIDAMSGVVEFAYQRSVSLVGEEGDMLLPDTPDPDDVAVTGRLGGTDYVVTSWTLDGDQLTLPSGYDTFTVDYVMDELETWNVSEQYEDEPLQDSDDAADPVTITVGHDLQHEPDVVTSCTVDGVAATYTLSGLNVVADSPTITERQFTLVYEMPVTLEVPASEFATGPYELPYEPLGTVTTICGGVVLPNSVSGLGLTISSLVATSAYYTISYTEQVEQDVVELPCTPFVAEGQFVDIAIVNGMPTVIGASGSGDAVAAAADAAETAATAAQAVAEAVNQHFWTDGSGVHVTEVTQEDWLDPLSPNYQSGANQLSNSAGILLRDGLTNFAQLTPGETAFYDGQGNSASNVVATFGTSGSVIGKAAESHAFIDYHSLQMVDAEGSVYFHVSDLRDQGGTAEITETFVADGTTRDFYLHMSVLSVVGATVNGAAASYTESGSLVTLDAFPARGDVVAIVYVTDDQMAKAYTLGFRVGDTGAMSVAEGANVESSGVFAHAEGEGTASSGLAAHSEGRDTIASGDSCHAEGRQTTATGLVAHAEGIATIASNGASHAEGMETTASGSASHAQNRGTIAQGTNQTALGKYNVADSTSALIIGNGTADNARSNALTVDWSGNVNSAGNAIAQNMGGAAYASDLDDLTVPGIYYCTTASTNGPVASTAGQCVVAANASQANVVQLYTTYGNAPAIYARRLYSGTWSTWQALGDTVAEDAPTLSNASATTFVVRRKNGIATLYVRELAVSTALASGSSVSIATLPAGYRPAYTTGIPLTSTTANAARGVWLYITSGGAVSIYNRSGNSLTTSSNLYGTGTYVM